MAGDRALVRSVPRSFLCIKQPPRRKANQRQSFVKLVPVFYRRRKMFFHSVVVSWELGTGNWELGTGNWELGGLTSRTTTGFQVTAGLLLGVAWAESGPIARRPFLLGATQPKRGPSPLQPLRKRKTDLPLTAVTWKACPR